MFKNLIATLALALATYGIATAEPFARPERDHASFDVNVRVGNFHLWVYSHRHKAYWDGHCWRSRGEYDRLCREERERQEREREARERREREWREHHRGWDDDDWHGRRGHDEGWHGHRDRDDWHNDRDRDRDDHDHRDRD
jgi:hypothetical protein